jgi:hypothetical protein
MKVHYHDNPKFDRRIRRVVWIVVSVGGIFTTGTAIKQCAPDLDAMNTTHTEAKIFDDEAIKNHEAEVAGVPYAMKSDVDHIFNTMIQEQIDDYTEEVREIEDLEDEGKATPKDLRKKQRTLESIERKKLEFTDDGHDHQ